MNRSQMIAATARRLRQFRKRDVAEMLDALIEVWHEELLQPGGYVRIEGLGKLYVERQAVRTDGAVARILRRKQKPVPETLTRTYVRFRPTKRLRQALASAEQRKETRP